jgi:MoaA/NifB/PqqE/SkfB family radical SAM enzyme
MTSEKYILDGHKLLYHMDRVRDWYNGKRVAPITIDWALTQKCQYKCIYCYAKAQRNKSDRVITKKAAINYLDDAKDIGVKSTSLVSDGENTLAPFFYDVVTHGKQIGLDMACATNGYALKKERLPEILESLTYLRFSFSAVEPHRYSEIHGVPPHYLNKVKDIIKECVKLKRENGYNVTLGLQMVLLPQFGDQIIPLAELGKELGVDYTVIKHCSDNKEGSIGVNYDGYKSLYPLIEKAESYTTENYLVKAKWSKIRTCKDRKYIQCYAPPLMLQTSGTGIVAPCGPLFDENHSKYHIGNMVDTRLKDMFESKRYWDIMNTLATNFDARKECAWLCLQDKCNEFLWDLKQGTIDINKCHKPPVTIPHVNFP